MKGKWAVTKYFSRLYSNLKCLTPLELLFRGSIMLFAMATTSVYWNMMKFFTKNEIPMTLVLTGSMEPGFIRGDAVAVYTQFDRAMPQIGDIVVWKMTQKPVPIVHRLIEKRVIDGLAAYVTKGDANAEADIGLYDNGRTFLRDNELLATAEFNCPALGYQTLFFKEQRWFQLYYWYNILKNGFMGYYDG